MATSLKPGTRGDRARLVVGAGAGEPVMRHAALIGAEELLAGTRFAGEDLLVDQALGIPLAHILDRILEALLGEGVGTTLPPSRSRKSIVVLEPEARTHSSTRR